MAHRTLDNRRRFPDRKISETLIDFAKPVIEVIDENTTERDLRDGFTIAITVWNAHVLDTANGTRAYNEMIRKALGAQFETNPLVQSLIRRKRDDFFEDMRAISDWTVRYENGDLNLRAEARDPLARR